MNDESRRDFFKVATLSALAAGLHAGEAAAAEPAIVAGGAFGLQHAAVPLPFDPQKLAGLSGKLLQSHWENNYMGSVRALNLVRGKLAQALADADTPAYLFNGLKREQLLRTGSVVLHELYFANLGGDGRPGAALRSRIAASFGSFDAWEAEFRKMSSGLGGGSGWVVLGFNPALGVLENYWMADHASGAVGAQPLLVIDLYEHSYALDYGAATARYIDAFFANIQWDTVSRRLEQAGGA